MDVNPGMIEDGLTENDFIAVVSTDLLGSCKEDEGTVKNNIVRLGGAPTIKSLHGQPAKLPKMTV